MSRPPKPKKPPMNAARAAWDAGLIAECNRQVLQQFGFALAVDVAWDGTVTGLSMSRTDDPEGFVFGDASLDIIRAKLTSFMTNEGAALLAARERALGYVIQPL